MTNLKGFPKGFNDNLHYVNVQFSKVQCKENVYRNKIFKGIQELQNYRTFAQEGNVDQ